MVGLRRRQRGPHTSAQRKDTEKLVRAYGNSKEVYRSCENAAENVSIECLPNSGVAYRLGLFHSLMLQTRSLSFIDDYSIQDAAKSFRIASNAFRIIKIT